jgi:hypothetical protein
MKITVEAAAKMTKLSVSSVRQKSAKLKLGKQEGGKKIFTMAEVKKLKGVKQGPRKAKKAKKPAARKRVTSSRASKPVPAVHKKEEVKVEAKAPVIEKRPFWGFLGIGRKPKAKVSLMALDGKK